MCLNCYTGASLVAGQEYRLAPVQAQRRLFLRHVSAAAAGGLVAATAQAQVDVGRSSSWRKLVSAEGVERGAAQQYAQILAQARAQGALIASSDRRVQLLHAMARRMIVHTPAWNPRTRLWRWEVNLIRSGQVNAFCMPGGKIVFFTGMLDKLKLSIPEAAVVMGHEMAHALREHAREQMAKSTATRVGASVLSQIFGLGDLGNMALGLGAQLLDLRYSRSDESDADLVGLELSARAGFDPHASVSLWQKMRAQSGGGSLEFLSSHPSDNTRIRQLQAAIPKVLGLYEQARATQALSVH